MTQFPVKETPRAVAILASFLASESAGGIVLMLAALAALIVANSPLSAGYFSILHSVWLGLSVELWINDGLMAVFFLMVGLEIKREVLAGGLSTWGQRALPGFAAAGGMLIPALIYIAINWGNPQTMSGWAIPAATDIAFALGVLSLLGNRVPTSLKVFLAALAILDDLGAVTIIAFFYSSGLNLPMLGAAFATLAVLIVMNRLNVRRLLPYLLLGALLWFFVLQSAFTPRWQASRWRCVSRWESPRKKRARRCCSLKRRCITGSRSPSCRSSALPTRVFRWPVSRWKTSLIRCRSVSRWGCSWASRLVCSSLPCWRFVQGSRCCRRAATGCSCMAWRSCAASVSP